MTRKRLVSSVLLVLLASTAVLAQSVGIPLRNWTVPPYRTAAGSGGIGTMADVTPGVAFVGVDPCRLVDTRAVAGFPAGYGPPSMTAGVNRNFDLNSAGHCSGIPAGVEAYSLNITVTNTQGPGFIKIWPQGGAIPDVSTLNYVAGETIANAAIVPAGTGGGITAVAGVSGTDLIIDVNGYFTDEFNPGNRIEASVSSTGAAIRGINISSGSDSYGIEGVVPGSSFFSAGVRGRTEGAGKGVWGTSAAAGEGVFGSSQTGVGVYGEVLTMIGGVNGILGRSRSSSNDSAGVRGFDGGGVVGGTFTTAGVRGESAGTANFGVLGLSRAVGVGGFRVSLAGNVLTGGNLGFTDTVGVAALGETSATGTKNFLEPHPSDPSKMIRYISLEGNEAGTYFRGRGKFQNGIAVIEVPEDFRIVTDPEGLAVQVTPIGQMATVAVESIGLDRIVVRGSRNVEFFYTVNGIRHAYKHYGPIAENDKMFVPQRPDEPMPAYLPAVLQQRLISNGTYTADGKVNMETAQRLGWDKIWEKRSRPVPQPEQP